MSLRDRLRDIIGGGGGFPMPPGLGMLFPGMMMGGMGSMGSGEMGGGGMPQGGGPYGEGWEGAGDLASLLAQFQNQGNSGGGQMNPYLSGQGLI